MQVTWEDLAAAEQAVGTFGGDNRAGVQGTLHRISAIRNRKGTVIGLTCRVGRAVTGHIDMIRDMLEGKLMAACFCLIHVTRQACYFSLAAQVQYLTGLQFVADQHHDTNLHWCHVAKL